MQLESGSLHNLLGVSHMPYSLKTTRAHARFPFFIKKSDFFVRFGVIYNKEVFGRTRGGSPDAILGTAMERELPSASVFPAQAYIFAVSCIFVLLQLFMERVLFF